MVGREQLGQFRSRPWARPFLAFSVAVMLASTVVGVCPRACLAQHGQAPKQSKVEMQAAAAAARLRTLQKARNTSVAKPISAKSGLLAPRAAMDPSPYGISAVKWTPYVCSKVDDLGIRWVRVFVMWNWHEPTEGHYEWEVGNWDGMGKLDTWIPYLASRGYSISVLIETPPTWALDKPGGLPVPSKMAAFCHELATRYNGKIAAYEILTEENTQAPDDASRQAWRFVPVLKECYLAIKAVNPNNIVAMSGVPGPRGDPTYRSYIGDLYRAGAKDYFDVANIHFYPGNDQNEDPIPGLVFDLAQIRWVMGRYGDANKKLWVTEFGYGVPNDSQNDGQYTEAEQATYLTTSLDAFRRSGIVERVFLYQLRNNDGMAIIHSHFEQPEGSDDHFRPAYAAYKSYIAQRPRWNGKDVVKAWQTDRALAVSMPNAGFENGTTGWYGNAVLDSTVSHSGRSSGKIVMTGIETGAFQVVDLAPSASAYMVIGYLKNNGGVGARMAVTFTNGQNDNLGHTNLNTIYDTRSIPDGWHMFQAALRVPAGATKAYVYLWAKSGSGTIWFDDIEMVPFGVATTSQVHTLD